jgi:hypothetical protein
MSRAGHLPIRIADSATLVRSIGNVGVHSAQKAISEADFASALQNLLHVLGWYERDQEQFLKSEVQAIGAESPGAMGGAYANKIVIMPPYEAGSDVAEEWHALRKYLINYGVKVWSDEANVSDSSPHRSALFVQLISVLDRLDRPRIQVEKFGLSYGSPRLFQWRKTLPKSQLNPILDFESVAIKSLDWQDRRFCEGAQTGSFEEFKLQVRSQLEKASGDRPYLYLTFDRSNESDDRYATKLVKIAAELADVKVMPSRNQKKDFFSALKKASGFVFLFGDTEPSFIEDWIGRYIEGKRAMKSNVGLAALYQAPPKNEKKRETELKIGLRREEWRMYGSREEFIPEDIGQYCAELRRDGD